MGKKKTEAETAPPKEEPKGETKEEEDEPLIKAAECEDSK